MENFSLIFGMLSPFITLIMGWIFETRVKKKEKALNERKLEEERLNEEIENLKNMISSLESKLKACQRVHDTETLEEQVNKVVYINEKTLAYCFSIGKLSKIIARWILDKPEEYASIQTEIKDVYKSIVSYDTALNERIMSSAMKSQYNKED